MKIGWMRGIGLLGCALIAGLANGYAEEAAPDTLSQAKERLAPITKRYAEAKSWTATVTVRSQIASEGQEQNSSVTYKLSVRKPDRFLVRHAAGMRGPEFLLDGSRAVVYAPQANRFSERLGPTPLATMMTNQSEPVFLIFIQAIPVVYTLLAEDPKTHMLEGVTAGRVETDKDGRVRIAFEQNDHDWIVEATTGDRPAIEKILVDMTKTVRTAQPQSTATWKIALEFTDWVFDGALPDSVFSMEIPPSTIRIPYTELVPAPQDQPGPVAP
jgi:outer membrane lipoprotein-sorting protein